MTPDIVAWLRHEATSCELAQHTHWVDPDGLLAAADEIERLRSAATEREASRNAVVEALLRRVRVITNANTVSIWLGEYFIAALPVISGPAVAAQVFAEEVRTALAAPADGETK